MSVVSALLNSGKTFDFAQAFGARDVTTAEMKTAIGEWFRLYYDKTATKDSDPCQQIPGVIVEKLTKTVFSEYVATPGKNQSNADFVGGVLAGLDRVRQKAVQLALIGGVDWLKPIFQADGVEFNVISRENVLILDRDDMDRVTSIGSAERTVAGTNYYTLLERRTVDANGYLTIENRLYSSADKTMLGSAVPLSTLDKYAALEPIYTTPTPVWTLGLIPVRTPIENCVDGSPDAVSVYAKAVGLIHNINHNEALLNGEFDRGKSRIIASADMLTDKHGKRSFDDTLFVAVEDDPESVGVTIFSPALREQSFLARKVEYLRNVETVIGLKRGLLSDVEAVERTAKEITSSEGDYNLTIIHFQQMWETAVREAVRVCAALGKIYNVYNGPDIDTEKDIIISWGNGVLYDEDKKWAELNEMVASGLLKPEIALGWYFDMPTETEADLAKIRAKYMPDVAGEGGDA